VAVIAHTPPAYLIPLLAQAAIDYPIAETGTVRAPHLLTLLYMFRLKLFYGHLGPLPHPTSQGIGIPLPVDDARDAGVDEHLRADDTGEVGTVEDGAIDGDPVIGSLDDGVLLGVQSPTEFVTLARWYPHLIPQAAHL
jgi:hypothetical protein